MQKKTINLCMYLIQLNQIYCRVNTKLPKKTKTESSNSRTVDVRGHLHSTPTRAARPTGNHCGMDIYKILH